MATLFINKVRTKDDKYGVHKTRYRVINERSTARVLAQVSRLTRWGWTMVSIGGITPRAIIAKTEVVTDDGETAEVSFPKLYDVEQQKYVSVYHKYVTKWAISHKKLLSHTNVMLMRGYEVAMDVGTVFGYRRVYKKIYVKDMAEEQA